MSAHILASEVAASILPGARIHAGQTGVLSHFEVVAADPRVGGLAREIGSTAVLISAGAVAGVYEKVGAGNSDWTKTNAGGYAELSGAGTALDVTGLDGDADLFYGFFAKLINNSGAIDCDVVIRPNGVTTNLRSGGTVTSATAINLMTIRPNGQGAVHGVWSAKTGAIRNCVFDSMSYDAAGSSTQLHINGQWTETATNLTSMRIATAGGTLAAGSLLAMWPLGAKVRT